MTPAPATRDERGTISIYILGLTMIVLLLVAGTVAVTSAHLSRMRMLDAADGAALSAANVLDESAYTAGVGESVPLGDASVRDRAASYLASTRRPDSIASWGVDAGTGSPDGRTAVVALTGEARLPMVGGALRDLGVTITIHVVSRARSDIVTP